MSQRICSAARSSTPGMAVAATAVILVAGLAACSGEESDTDQGRDADRRKFSPVEIAAGTGGYPEATGKCALLDPAQVEAVLGEATPSARSTGCTVRGRPGDAIVILSAGLDAGGLTDFRAVRDTDPSWIPVPDIGDAAYFTRSEEKTGRPSLAVASGTDFAYIDLYLTDEGLYSPDEMIAMLAPLGATAADRLPAEN